MSDKSDIDLILATARELYGKAVYSHKAHEIEREYWSHRVDAMNNVNIGLAAATTFFAIVAASFQPLWATILTAMLATATVSFVVWQSSLDPAGKANDQRVAAKELLWLREQLLLLITECHLSTSPLEHLQKRLEMLTREITAAYRFAPNTSPRSIELAEKAIKGGKINFSDDEIDTMLPTEFRKCKPQAQP